MPRCSLSVCPVILMWAYSISSDTEVPCRRFSMIRVYLQWQELAWDSKSSSMRFEYLYFTGYEVFNLWFVKHMLHNCTRINFNHSRCLWWGKWELKASKYLQRPTYYPLEYYVGLRHTEDEVPSHRQHIGQSSTTVELQRSIITTYNTNSNKLKCQHKVLQTEFPKV
jgi:hypothetical protein